MFKRLRTHLVLSALALVVMSLPLDISAEVVGGGSHVRRVRNSGIIKNCQEGGGFERMRSRCTVVRETNGDLQGANCGSPHKGIDFPRADRGQPAPPVYSLRKGKVVFAGYRQDYGNRVVIDEGNGRYSTYNHLKNFAVAAGNKSLPAGTILGIMGNTGASDGVHLHLEAISGNKFVNPGTEYLKYCE